MNEILNKEEIKKILDYLIKTTRNILDIEENDSVKCIESSLFLRRLCDKIDIPYIPFANNELGMKELEHYYGIVAFNTEIGQVCFLIDATYIQFDKEKYPIEGKLVTSPGKYINGDLKQQLINNGYFTMTHENIIEYLNSFVTSYNNLYKINNDLVITKFYKMLENFNIKVKDDDYLNNNFKQR